MDFSICMYYILFLPKSKLDLFQYYLLIKQINCKFLPHCFCCLIHAGFLFVLPLDLKDVTPKHPVTFTGLHCIIAQNMDNSVTTAVRTATPT